MTRSSFGRVLVNGVIIMLVTLGSSVIQPLSTLLIVAASLELHRRVIASHIGVHACGAMHISQGHISGDSLWNIHSGLATYRSIPNINDTR